MNLKIDPDNLPTYHNLTKTQTNIEALLYHKLEALDEPLPPQDPNSTTPDDSNSTHVPLCRLVVDDNDSATIVG